MTPTDAPVEVQLHVSDPRALVNGWIQYRPGLPLAIALDVFHRWARSLDRGSQRTRWGRISGVRIVLRTPTILVSLYTYERLAEPIASGEASAGGPVGDRGSWDSVPEATASVTIVNQRGKARQSRSHSAPSHEASSTPTPSDASSSSDASRPRRKARRAPRDQKS